MRRVNIIAGKMYLLFILLSDVRAPVYGWLLRKLKKLERDLLHVSLFVCLFVCINAVDAFLWASKSETAD